MIPVAQRRKRPAQSPNGCLLLTRCRHNGEQKKSKCNHHSTHADNLCYKLSTKARWIAPLFVHCLADLSNDVLSSENVNGPGDQWLPFTICSIMYNNNSLLCVHVIIKEQTFADGLTTYDDRKKSIYHWLFWLLCLTFGVNAKQLETIGSFVNTQQQSHLTWWVQICLLISADRMQTLDIRSHRPHSVDRDKINERDLQTGCLSTTTTL